MKRILILGKKSYIGKAFKQWLNKYPNVYSVEIVSSSNHEWKNADFAAFDTVVDFAGIAHINNITEDMRDLFYSVNRDLSIDIATWAKLHGVKHFIFLFSAKLPKAKKNGFLKYSGCFFLIKSLGTIRSK